MKITIDKYRTNEILKQNGLLVAEHILVSCDDWKQNRSAVEELLINKIKLPFIWSSIISLNIFIGF